MPWFGDDDAEDVVSDVFDLEEREVSEPNLEHVLVASFLSRVKGDA